MQKLESDVYNNADYQSSICQLASGNCVQPDSILRLFDGTYSYLNKTSGSFVVFAPNPTFANIDIVVSTAYGLNGAGGIGPNLRQLLDYVLGAGMFSV